MLHSNFHIATVPFTIRNECCQTGVPNSQSCKSHLHSSVCVAAAVPILNFRFHLLAVYLGIVLLTTQCHFLLTVAFIMLIMSVCGTALNCLNASTLIVALFALVSALSLLTHNDLEPNTGVCWWSYYLSSCSMQLMFLWFICIDLRIY